MSGPFIYSPPHQDYFPPPASSTAYWGPPYQSPPISTPFLPNESVFSPFSGTPNTPERPFPSGLNGHGWNGTSRRRRRGSWNGGSAPRISPFIPPPPLPAFLERRRSWSNVDAGWHTADTLPPSPYPPFPSQLHSHPQPQPISVPSYPHHHQYPHFSAPPYSAPPYSAPPYSAPLPYVPGYPQFPGSLEIHPWINGEAPSREFFFDLSVTDFLPCRMLGEQGAVRLTHADLAQPAFHPPITRLRIVCDMILQWPIDLVFGNSGGGMSFAGMGQAPPITVGDILIAVHQKMHQPITHLDWSRLSMSEETAVSRAFTRRCKRESVREGARVHFEELPERQKGVKVVDFLRGRNIFRGLVRGADGSVRLAVSE
ncbi:hypothetical protein C8F04DRAFT_1115166 [Mycena alexandri]|uniref:DUF6699 domain-containing protein n=1 Tax=Mycena alexandri TaxID=1745969 RepID=A0AAD6SM70_9AGAR|nr:hypothetical protein C8F04DRAFT_1115166 [Mycena alexandri]